MTPRYYQVEALEAILDYFEHNTGNPIVAMPTGTGKSIVIAAFVKYALTEFTGQRVLMLTHVKELVEQNFETLLRMWPTAPAGICSAGLKRTETRHAITFAGIGSIVRRIRDLRHIDLVIVDECHLVGNKESSMYLRALEALRETNPNVKVVGFSASPYRMKSGLLTEGSVFTDVCYDITKLEAFNKLVTEGYIAPLVPKRPQVYLDASNVGLVGGEYNIKELQACVDRDTITTAAVEEMIEYGADRKHWLIFASGTEHSDHIAEKLNARGYPAVSVHSRSGDDRDASIAAFRAGKVRALVNNNILTTGFDFAPIDLVAVLRPTRSPGLWVQMLGRGTRPAPGKVNCMVLDYARNTERLGPINDPVMPRSGKKHDKGKAPYKVCAVCSTYNATLAKVCAYCGERFPLPPPKYKPNAGLAEVMRGDPKPPQRDTLDVGHVEYHLHVKRDTPPSIRVVYSCGIRQVSEWVCLEHPGFVSRKARQWWRQRTQGDGEPPTTTREGLDRSAELDVPVQIVVETQDNGFLRVVDHVFSTGGSRPVTTKQVTLDDEDVPF